jgi:6-phosphogluconolactonase
MPPQVVVGNVEQLTDALTRRLEREAREALGARGRFAIALPGGSVAEAFFPRLARAGVAWSRADFFWGDERAVPAADPESNFALARRLWLGPTGVPADRIHRMVADAGDLEAAAADYADAMTRVLGSPPRLDVALLGVGPDGHVCSLFPGHQALREERRFVVAVLDSPKLPPRRLTLTLPTLAAARLVVVAAMGEAKAAPVREALSNPASTLPVALVARRAKGMLFLLDEAASAGVWGRTLERRPRAPAGS